jgi:hypothetical protein
MTFLFRRLFLRLSQGFRKAEMDAQKLYRSKPLVIIYGATGTGKTKLSVQLAKRYGDKAEILNADAMQVFIDFFMRFISVDLFGKSP